MFNSQRVKLKVIMTNLADAPSHKYVQILLGGSSQLVSGLYPSYKWDK